jgi:hypothetical protein
MFLKREAVYLRSEIEELQAELELFQTRLTANEEKQKQLESMPSNMMEREVSRDAQQMSFRVATWQTCRQVGN